MKPGPRFPWLAAGLVVAALLAVALTWALSALPVELPPCPLKETLGIPCATCGGTRCALALARGHLGEAFHWHPVLAFLALLSPLVLLWDLRPLSGRGG